MDNRILIVKNHILTAIQKKGWTVTYFMQEVLQMSANGFYKMLNKGTLSIERLFKISDLLEIDPTDLLGGDLINKGQANLKELEQKTKYIEALELNNKLLADKLQDIQIK